MARVMQALLRRSATELHLFRRYLSMKVEENAAKNQLNSATVNNVAQHFVNGDLISATDDETRNVMIRDFLVYANFVSEEEEKAIFEEVEPYLKRLKYESSHWDDAIHGYRETERKVWTQRNKAVLERVRRQAFPPEATPLAHVHVLDLQASGVIKPHIDSPRFCGDIVAGLSLLSSCVMRLVGEKAKDRYADVLLPRRSLYIMRGRARYEFTHEVLAGDMSRFKGAEVPRERRVAVICRNGPNDGATSPTEH